MKVNIFNIYLLISFIIFIISSDTDKYYNHTSADNNLYFVFSTYRHGARYAFTLFRRDYFGNYIPSRGALTPYGAKQHLEIGKRYRERYSKFLNMSFNPKEMYIRSSDAERTVISTLKELEGLFNKTIDRKYLTIVNGGLNFWNVYQINNKDRETLEKYFKFCRIKGKRRLPNIDEIFPILKECYGVKWAPTVERLCESVFSAYYEYTYDNKTDNKIGKCGKENADKMHDFCVRHYDTLRGWDENGAYMFYMLFQNIFRYMVNAIEGTSDLKMVMIGGHDITVDKFMNFLDGLKIIPRTHYPHYACNIVIELRKYNEEFYLEFYYNDILKYNETFQTFADTLDNSKYSNMYNYCGVPSWAQNIKTESLKISSMLKGKITPTQKVQETIKNKIIPPTQKIEETIKKIEIPTTQTIKETVKKHPIPTTQTIQETTKKEEIPTTKPKQEIIPTTQVKKEETKKVVIPTTQVKIEETKKVEIPITQVKIEETKKVVIPTTQVKKEETKKSENIYVIPKTNSQVKETEKIEIHKTESEDKQKEIDENKNIRNNNNTLINLTNEMESKKISNTNSTLKEQLKKFFNQKKDLNFYLILIGIVFSIFAIIFSICLIRSCIKKKRKFTRLSEENTKGQPQDSLSVGA